MDCSGVDYLWIIVILSFWRHPFTADDPLVSKWWNTIFLRCRNRLICSPNSSSSWMTWGWVNFRLSKGWNISGKFPKLSNNFGNFPGFFETLRKFWEFSETFGKLPEMFMPFCNPSKFSANFHFLVNYSFNDCCQTFLFKKLNQYCSNNSSVTMLHQL